MSFENIPQQPAPNPPAPLNLDVEVARLRARRVALLTPNDLDAFESAAQAVIADLKAHPGMHRTGTATAVILAIATVLGAFLIAAGLFWVGDLILGSFNA